MAFRYPRCTILQGAECDTDLYLVIAKVRERLSARKQVAQKTDVEGFNISKLSEMKVRKEFQTEVSTTGLQLWRA